MDFLNNLITIIGVILLFNLMIFIHELGHFLAARWRGLVVDKFYIWFGKPIWKKTINGVEYGLGSIPAGGFVALPQMAPMEAIEGGDKERRRQMAPISPLDKIIVAFAGPLFSFLLALVASLGVWVLGKPDDSLDTTTIGYVESGSPAEKYGLQVGDKILEIDDQPVTTFFGGMEGVMEKIMLSDRELIRFKVDRGGSIEIFEVEPRLPETKAWERKGMREVGISYESPLIVDTVKAGSPAEAAGFKEGDVLLSAEGKTLRSNLALGDILKENLGKTITVEVRRAEKEISLEVESIVPLSRKTQKPIAGGRPMIGIGFTQLRGKDRLVRPGPNPWEQIKESVSMMVVTMRLIVSKVSPINIEHLSGPIGIGGAMFSFLKSDYALHYILWFMVILNINLGIMNLLPFPVLDGGHIVLAIGEWFAKRPVQFKLLETIQTVAVVLLLCLFVFIATKDIGDLIPRGDRATSEDLYWPKK